MAEAGSKQEVYVGVDMGGTKVLAGVFDSQLRLIGTEKVSTKSERGFAAVLERVNRVVRDAVDECDLTMKQVKGVGLGAPGAVDPGSGNVLFAPNLRWTDVPLKKELEKLLEVPVFIENDCNVCALGVFERQLKGKFKHVVGIFIGTGIGAGVILDGKLFGGFNRTAGEIGHMVIDAGSELKCGCGNKGCFEALASRTAIFKRLKDEVKRGEKTILTEMLGDDLANMRSGDLRKASRKNDKLVSKVIEEAAYFTGIAVANIINVLNPEAIVLGGGVIDALEDEMMSIITEVAKDYAMPGTSKGVQIIAAIDADNVGIVGAAVLARRESK